LGAYFRYLDVCRFVAGCGGAVAPSVCTYTQWRYGRADGVSGAGVLPAACVAGDGCVDVGGRGSGDPVVVDVVEAGGSSGGVPGSGSGVPVHGSGGHLDGGFRGRGWTRCRSWVSKRALERNWRERGPGSGVGFSSEGGSKGSGLGTRSRTESACGEGVDDGLESQGDGDGSDCEAQVRGRNWARNRRRRVRKKAGAFGLEALVVARDPELGALAREVVESELKVRAAVAAEGGRCPVGPNGGPSIKAIGSALMSREEFVEKLTVLQTGVLKKLWGGANVPPSVQMELRSVRHEMRTIYDQVDAVRRSLELFRNSVSIRTSEVYVDAKDSVW